MSLLGLSFSNSVLEIARGEVKKEEVKYVLASFSQEKLEQAIANYKQACWDDNKPNKCEKIARKLLEQGKVLFYLEDMELVKQNRQIYLAISHNQLNFDQHGVLLHGGKTFLELPKSF